MADELASAGRALSTAEFNAIIYRNIGSEFHPLVSALNLRPKPFLFQELHSHLLAHEIILRNFSEPPQAHVAYHNNQPSSSCPSSTFITGYSPSPRSHYSSRRPFNS